MKYAKIILVALLAVLLAGSIMPAMAAVNMSTVLEATIRVSGFRTCSLTKAAMSSTIRRNTTVRSVWIFTYCAIFSVMLTH